MLDLEPLAPSVDVDHAWATVLALRTRRRRRAVLVSATIAAIVAVGAIAAIAHGTASRISVVGQPKATTSTTAALQGKNGYTILADGNGNRVGYVSDALLHPRTPEDFKRITPQTLLPVTNDRGALVGYFAYAYGFVPLSTAARPHFDIEDLRAEQNGGCEPVIGSRSNHYKYPICPEPPPPTAAPAALPDVVGQDLAHATTALRNAGITRVCVSEATYPGASAGMVVIETPAPGTPIARVHELDLTLAASTKADSTRRCRAT